MCMVELDRFTVSRLDWTWRWPKKNEVADVSLRNESVVQGPTSARLFGTIGASVIYVLLVHGKPTTTERVSVWSITTWLIGLFM